MELNPIIHIGYNKTGTIWFQNNFFPLVENASLLNRDLVHKLLVRTNFFTFNPFEVRGMLDKESEKRIIISEEEFSLTARAQPHIKTAIIKQLHHVYPNAQIVVFIRNQVDRLLSLYLYYLKQNGGTYSFHNFIFKKNWLKTNLIDLKLENSKYHYYLNFISDVFGQSNVHIYLYEEFANNNIAFLKKFCNTHSLVVDLNRINFHRENKALKKNFIPIARFINLFTKPRIVDRSHILTVPYLDRVCRKIYPKLNSFSIWGRNAVPEDLLSTESIEYLNNYYRNSNRILAEKYSLPLEKYGYPI
ncbi:MAG: sulfotransferase [Bacteroidales bacterium]|jgi:hypothetical protein|nr:sulfotransferase [Bacteroidales bacterium]MDY0198812.1 sulfotransferase [Tenuifilaceae bacterium]